MIAYLQTYAAHFGFPVRRGAQVVAVRHVHKLFKIMAKEGQT